MKPKVYLAGKIHKHDWRERIVGWEIDFNGGGDFGTEEKWPRRWREVHTDSAIITGPFFVGCDHGCTHGKSTHATAGGCEDDNYARARRAVARLCLDAIHRSDLVFAWLDSTSAFGTIAEIGYAAGKGIPVWVATPPCPNGVGLGDYEVPCGCFAHGEMWFSQTMNGVRSFSAEDPVTGFDIAVTAFQAPSHQCDSPVEQMFWDTWSKTIAPYDARHPLHGLVPQHEVPPYRLDFAIPHKKFGIEVDGLAYHNGQTTFIADRRRQRDLELAGWRIIRFAAKEVMQDVSQCIRQANQLAARG